MHTQSSEQRERFKALVALVNPKRQVLLCGIRLLRVSLA